MLKFIDKLLEPCCTNTKEDRKGISDSRKVLDLRDAEHLEFR